MKTSQKAHKPEQKPDAPDVSMTKKYTDWFRTVKYADWFRTVDWCLYGTFTFAHKVSDRQAEQKFDEFISRLECLHKCDVGYLRGDEKRISGCGKPASGRHFHALLVFTGTIHPERVEELWERFAGRRKNGAGAMVRPFDPHPGPNHDGDGVAYVLKYMNQPEGDWAFRKLHLFPPFSQNLKDTRRSRRHLRRHPELLQMKESQAQGDQPSSPGASDQPEHQSTVTSCNPIAENRRSFLTLEPGFLPLAERASGRRPTVIA